MDSNLLILLGILAIGVAAAFFAFGISPGDDEMGWRAKDLRDLETGDHRKARRKSRLRRLADWILRRRDD